jgi:hypothetical protein
MEMNENDLELKLLGNRPIYIDKVGELTFPNVEDVMDIGESYYNKIINSLLFKKENLEQNEEFEKLSEFELFYLYCYQAKDFRELVFNGLKLIFKDDPKIDDGILGIYFGDVKDGRVIDGNNFEIIQHVVAKAHWIKIEAKKEEEFKPFDERAQAIIDMVMKGRKERSNIKPKVSVNLHSIIAGLTWKSNGISLKEIMTMTIYQLYMGYFVSQNIDSHYFMLTGIYTGNIDAKNIDMSEINWAKRLEV